jgi:hypothetical protein
MKHTGILFSTAMVMAILEGRKTQTRRVVKPQPKEGEFTQRITVGADNIFEAESTNQSWKCPYGAAGDLLYVRETCYAWGKWVPNGFTKTGKQKWKFIDLKKVINGIYLYCDDKIDKMGISPNSLKDGKAHWYKRPGLFMPKAAVRLFLQVEKIRVERLESISHIDAVAEGVELLPNGRYKYYLSNYFDCINAQMSYMTLWKKINGEESWNENPWVWVVEFKKVSKPQNW